MGYAVLVLLFVAYALSARWLEAHNLTGPMCFLIAGLVFGAADLPELFGGIGEHGFLLVMTLTLALLLFADASTVDIAALRGSARVPLRLLLIGLPLTVVAGTVGARLLLPTLSVGAALLVGVILAPTDVSLGLAMFSNDRVPASVRRGINVESGLNDGLAAPLVAIAISVVLSEVDQLRAPVADAIVQIAVGVAVGVLVGLLGGAALRSSERRGWSSEASRAFAAFGLAALSYLGSVALHGNGFVAAFVGGLVFGAVAREHAEHAARFAEESGSLLSLLVWFAFGAVVAPVLLASGLEWRPLLYAVLSLTAFRMLPVGVALLGTGNHVSTAAFMGWFGPRGLASVIFLLDALTELEAAGIDTQLLAATAGWTIVLSVLLHGASAGPVAAWYARRSESFASDSPELASSSSPRVRAGFSAPVRPLHDAESEGPR